MGFLSRMIVPRGVRRAANPVRTAKSAVAPKTVKKARWSMHPVDNAVYGVQRSLNTKSRSGSTATKHTHRGCSINHRTTAARDKCRNA